MLRKLTRLWGNRLRLPRLTGGLCTNQNSLHFTNIFWEIDIQEKTRTEREKDGEGRRKESKREKREREGKEGRNGGREGARAVMLHGQCWYPCKQIQKGDPIRNTTSLLGLKSKPREIGRVWGRLSPRTVLRPHELSFPHKRQHLCRTWKHPGRFQPLSLGRSSINTAKFLSCELPFSRLQAHPPFWITDVLPETTWFYCRPVTSSMVGLPPKILPSHLDWSSGFPKTPLSSSGITSTDDFLHSYCVNFIL